MPNLDVSEVLLDPDLADRFEVVRRKEVVSEDTGRSSTTQQRFRPVIGVVTNSSPNDLLRLSDYDMGQRYLTIVTKFRLQLPTPNSKPDLVVWRGGNFITVTCEPYPQYGAGFYQAIVCSTDLIEPVI